MIPFLKQVASEYLGRGGISDKCFVFPNRRSMVFFMKYLSETFSEDCSGKNGASPIFAPEALTMNDFMYKLYDVRPTDRISLLIILYECYRKLNQSAETLDDFIFWGDVLLGDFNDVDKYLVDAAQLFANVSDLKSIQDTYSYLTDTQRTAIENFVRHFHAGNSRLTVDLGSSKMDVKARFLQIWNILHPLYTDFRHTLKQKGMAYEGMVYRSVAENLSAGDVCEKLGQAFPHSGKFVFVGLNALNECEKTVLRKMRDSSVAEFCWDYSGDMIQDSHNKSSYFMSLNVKEFPQAFKVDPDGVSVPEINVVSVPSSVGQVKQLPGILEKIARENCGGNLSMVGTLSEETCGMGADCAVVLPDEGLLMPVLNTIPQEISQINVTMGYPLTSSAFYSFMQAVCSLQMNLRKKDGKWYFYHKYLRPFLANPVFKKACGEEVCKKTDLVRGSAELYVDSESLFLSEYTSLIFRPVVTDRTKADASSCAAFAAYLKEVAMTTATLLCKDRKFLLEVDFAKEYADAVTRLSRCSLSILPSTFIHLLEQLLSSVSVPFKGEPLQGLQIMGPLETRALDFSNIILMSANEGVFPKKNVSSSFIPPELRRGFSLPTYEFQDAVWAYYFYRMITRAGSVWILYDSRTEGIRSGEESRYVKQLQYHFNVPMVRYVVRPALSSSESDGDVAKTDGDVEKIRNMTFSASSLQTYLSCPLKFYYKYILNLKTEDDVSENVDSGVFGSVYHAVMQALYMGEEAMASHIDFDDRAEVAKIANVRTEITADYITSWLSRKNEIKDKVGELIRMKLHTFEISGRNLVVQEVIVQYVLKTLERDLEFLEKTGAGGFVIYGLEKPFLVDCNGFKIKGYIDRLDGLRSGEVRVVDYKTGKVHDEDENINDENAEAVADAVFGDSDLKRPKIALQLYVYDKFLKSDSSYREMRKVNCIYSASGMFVSPPKEFEVSEVFHSAVDERLAALFAEMSDVSVPFRRAEDAQACVYCDFKMICGK